MFPHLVVDKYPQAVERYLGMPYKQHVWGTHVHGKDTMTLISVEDVMEQLDKIF
jgi:heptosyltransferase I